MFRKIKELIVIRKHKKMELEFRRFYCFSSWSNKNPPKKNEDFNSYIKRYMSVVKK